MDYMLRAESSHFIESFQVIEKKKYNCIAIPIINLTCNAPSGLLCLSLLNIHCSLFIVIILHEIWLAASQMSQKGELILELELNYSYAEKRVSE